MFLSQNWKFTAPVFVGDTITAHAEVTSVHATKPVTALRIRITRQDGEVVLEGEAWCLRQVAAAGSRPATCYDRRVITRDECLALDAADPLAPFRSLFDLDRADARGEVYLDGNRLPALPRAVSRRIQEVVQHEWGAGLIAVGTAPAGSHCRSAMRRRSHD